MSNNNSKTVAFYTLGCKVNSYDTQAMMELFEKNGYKTVDFDENADIYIINTCTVTNIGDKKSRQMLRRAKRKNPDSVVIATGCYAQTSPEKLKALPEVDLILGTAERSRIVEIAENYKNNASSVFVKDFSPKENFEDLFISRSEGHTRSYVKIQEGCRQFCSYCIVPYARGPLRSRNKEDALKEIKTLAENGYKEVVLTGIHIASYGIEKNEKNALIDLIEKAAEIPGIERIRLSSLEPNLITEEFVKRLENIDKFCPHFHLSLQSGSNSVLKRMNRRYTAEEYQQKAEIIRKYFPHAAITTDIIVGFPGETVEEFEESFDFAEKIGFSQIHIFPYSKREGTPAAELKNQIEGPEKSRRAKILSEKEKELRHAFLKSNDGLIEEILYEKQTEPGVFFGHTKNYIPVLTNSETDLSGTIKKAKLVYNENSDRMTAIVKES